MNREKAASCMSDEIIRYSKTAGMGGICDVYH
jgi:hypothetical protein